MQVVVDRGIMPKELEDLVELPDSCKHVWEMFLELNQTRSSGFGISPITFTEIYSMSKLREIKLLQWEIDLIKRFDQLFLEHESKKIAKDNK